MESKLSFKTGILFVNLFVLTAVYGQIPEIPDIEISMKVWIRGDLTDAEMHSDIADIDITVPGHYRIYANAFYNSGDDQLNESFYLLVRNADGTIEYPVDANAGPYKVVVDDPGPKHGAWRDGGLFYFSAGRHVVELHHYYVIADIYPQFINIVMGGSESVRLDGIRVAYEPFQDGAVDINGNTPRIMPMNGSNVGVVYPGETFPYRIEIDNKERDILYAPRLICQIPGYVETDQFSLAPDEREGNKMYWNLADMNGQGKVAIDFTAKVPEPWNNGTTPIFSRAWLVVEQDRDPADNSDSDLDYIYIIPDETDTLLADLHLKIDSYPDSSVVTAGDTAKYAHGGDTLPYKVSFVNLGPDTAFNVSLINHLPRNVVAENFNLEPNESLTGVLVWNFAFVAPFTNIDITYNAQIDASLNIKDYLLINNALVSSPNDTILYNNFDSDTVIVNPLPPTPTDVPDLAVLHTVTTDTMVYIQNVLENAVRAGKSYQCRISVQNIGQAGAKNVKMWNFLPDSIRVDEFNIPFHYDFQNRIYWNYDSLAAGGSIDIDYTATVFDTLPFTPFPLTSQVGVFAEREVNTLNNFAQQTIYAVVDSDLVEPDLTDISVSQIATTDTFQMTNGDTVKFAATGKVYNIQIIVKNNGKTGAKDILITDVLPDSVSAVRFSPLPAHVASDSLKWFVSELAVRADTIMSIDVQVSENMPLGQNLLINRARVTAENEDPAFLYNNVSVDTVYNEGIPKPDTLAADVVMSLTSKTDSLGLDLLKYTRPGGEIEYQIKIVNTGPDTAYQMSVDNSLPRFVRVFDITPAPASTDSASIKWQFLSLAPDVRLDLTFKAQVDSPLVENKVMLLDSVRISARNDTVLTNNCAVDTVWAVQKEPVIPRYADLEIGKTALPVRTVIGNDVVFQVFLKNTGPDAATNIRIQDLLPDGMGYVSGAANVGIFDPQTRIWTIDALGVDAVAILSITASAKSAGWWTNSAFVAAADQNDPDLGNNAAYATVVVMEKDSTLPDLRLQKSADKAQMNIGENILFTIHLTNDGPVAANDIRVLDAIHPAFTYVSGQTGNGSYQPETALWQIDTLQVGATATLKIAATAKREGLAVNYAKITQVSPGDADGTNNDDAVYVNVGAGTLTEADLAVSKSILSLPDVPRVGDHVEFEIKITNLSSVTAQNVCVLERMPDGLSYISFSPVESDYSAATGIWNVRTLDAGESRVLILRAEILRTGKIKNCVHIENSDRQDPDVDNNESCAEIDIPVLGADIGVEVFVSPKWVQRNETADFNVLVTNHGPMSASVQVQNRFPAGLNLDFSSTATGEYNANSEVWNVGSLAAGDTAMLELNGTGKQLGLWTHYARILASDQTDPDSSNNSAAADAVVWEENTSLPDIHLVKSVNNPRVGLGESVIFTLVVANTGPHTARHIQVFDRMHPGFALQSFTADKGIFDAEWRIWAIDSL
ncbi:DUF11 domain-containing protein, partial [candidate division KSB1 bacterium]|nr:DUF11 domain-containing protein [candidate division KSB1 bacterium]